MADIFLSYASEDREAARALADLLARFAAYIAAAKTAAQQHLEQLGEKDDFHSRSNLLYGAKYLCDLTGETDFEKESLSWDISTAP